MNLLFTISSDISLTTSGDYYPFGMTMPGRSDQTSDPYRYGFQGQEQDNEITSTSGAHLDFGARVYDARLGKFLSVDPLTKYYPHQDPYMAMNGNPIIYNDPTGMGGELVITGKSSGTMKIRVVLYSDEVGTDALENLEGRIESFVSNELNTRENILTLPRNDRTMSTKDIMVKFDIQVEIMNYTEAKKDYSSNESVANNYFYIEDSKDNSGYSQGNTGIISKGASSETSLHEILHTLGFYSKGTDLHEHPSNPSSVLSSGGTKKGNDYSVNEAQSRFDQYVTKGDWNSLRENSSKSWSGYNTNYSFGSRNSNFYDSRNQPNDRSDVGKAKYLKSDGSRKKVK